MAKNKHPTTDPVGPELSRVELLLKDVPASELDEVVVIGYKTNGQLSVKATRSRFDFVQWLLNRTIVEMVLLEKEQEAARNQIAEVEAEAEATVAQ